MSKYTVIMNAGELVEKLEQSGAISQIESQRAKKFILMQSEDRELPLYIRIIVGIGAFISSICFLLFLSISRLIDFDSQASLILFGAIFVGTAIFVAKQIDDKEDTAKHCFLTQISFCIMAVGKMLFVGGVANLFNHNEEWGITIATLIISASTYHVFRMSIDRFLSTLAVLISFFINVFAERSLGSGAEITLNIFLFVQVIGAAILFTQPKIKRTYIPLAYALVFSLCIMVITFSVDSRLGFRNSGATFNPILMNYTFAIALAALIGWAAGGRAKLKSEPLLIALLGTFALAVISAPGIIFSILLMVLGYSKHERLLWLLGLLLMPVFLFFYYYNLQTTLLLKSASLIGSGAVLLAGRAYLAWRRLDREVIQ